jgi:hypothetical protein
LLLEFVVDWSFIEGKEFASMIKFQMTFDEPYMLGLLLKKSDKLFID